jgi:hypothetical protein
MREMMDPAVDALETYNLLSEMENIDARLEQTVSQFQPGRKRSMFSLNLKATTTDEKNTEVPGLDEFESMTVMDMEELKKCENVHDFSMLEWKVNETWEPVLMVVSRQHVVHLYSLPSVTECNNDESDEASVIRSALESFSGPTKSFALAASCAEQTDACLKFMPRDSDESDDRVEIRFHDIDNATKCFLGMQKLLDTSLHTPDGSGSEDESSSLSDEDLPEIVRI